MVIVAVASWCAVVCRGQTCPPDEDGYLCVVGTLNRYYECNSPWYVGWRDCPSGTICSDTSTIHSDVPCVPWSSTSSSDSDDDDDNDDGSESTTGSNATLVVTWSTWWLWVVIGVFCLVLLLVAWVGCVTWPGTHERLALLSNGHC